MSVNYPKCAINVEYKENENIGQFTTALFTPRQDLKEEVNMLMEDLGVYSTNGISTVPNVKNQRQYLFNCLCTNSNLDSAENIIISKYDYRYVIGKMAVFLFKPKTYFSQTSIKTMENKKHAMIEILNSNKKFNNIYFFNINMSFFKSICDTERKNLKENGSLIFILDTEHFLMFIDSCKSQVTQNSDWVAKKGVDLFKKLFPVILKENNLRGFVQTCGPATSGNYVIVINK